MFCWPPVLNRLTVKLNNNASERNGIVGFASIVNGIYKRACISSYGISRRSMSFFSRETKLIGKFLIENWFFSSKARKISLVVRKICPNENNPLVSGGDRRTYYIDVWNLSQLVDKTNPDYP